MDVPKSWTAGASGFILSSAAEMERQGHHVSFWFRDELVPQLAIPRLRRLLIPWVIVGKILLATRAAERIDIVEAHELVAGPYALIARFIGHTRLPACAVLSFGLAERGWQAQREYARVRGRRISLRRLLLAPVTLIPSRLSLCNAETILVPSSVDRDYLLGKGRPAERVTCCFTGVSENLFQVQPVKHDGVRVLFLGSWIERKGVSDLTAAWRRLAAERANVHLTAAGVLDEGLARADLKGLPRVEIIASIERDDLPALLAAHDIFVLPSWAEGMPLSMLEAAAVGLPCVVCAVCGNLDVFRPDDPQRDGAILIPPHDSEALYRALVTLVDDISLRATLGERAHKRARQFTWASSANQAIAAYTGAIQRRRGRRSA